MADSCTGPQPDNTAGWTHKENTVDHRARPRDRRNSELRNLTSDKSRAGIDAHVRAKTIMRLLPVQWKDGRVKSLRRLAEVLISQRGTGGGSA